MECTKKCGNTKATKQQCRPSQVPLKGCGEARQEKKNFALSCTSQFYLVVSLAVFLQFPSIFLILIGNFFSAAHIGAQESQFFPQRLADVPLLDGQVFLVMGGASGIGYELVKMLFRKKLASI